jgi:DNA repair exonuclease SbcCD ATPase subunit
MTANFPPIGGSHAGIGGENSFWPSFTDIMMVVTMIFLMATSLLVVRNWQLVAELQESIAAEHIAAQMIESTSLENATLEERLANAEQSNSILRLRVLKKDEELELAHSAIREQETSIASLELVNRELDTNLQQTRAQLDAANLEIDAATAQNQELTQQITALNQQLTQQIAALNQQLEQRQLADEQTRSQLDIARTQIAELSAASTRQQQSISQLTQDKTLLNQEIEAYNQQLLTLKGDYETVKSKYEELIKPARSARGKYIAEVYYVKGQSGNVIRYRQPGDEGYSRLSLTQVEKRLDKLKLEQGENLYVKIIIPEDSGLSYSEAWGFMRNLLVKYDYYYQE